MYSLSHIWPVCFPSGWCLCSFDMSPLFLVWFLTFWQYKVFQDFLVPSPRQPFLQGASFCFFFFKLENGIRDQNLSVGWAFWYSSVIASRSSYDRASYICIIIHRTHIHTHKHVHTHSTHKNSSGIDNLFPFGK